MAGTTIASEVGLEFPATSERLVEELADLCTAHARIPKFLLSEVPAAALTGPAFDWLLADPPPPPAGRGQRQVGLADVRAIRATTAVFARLDNRFGGAHARTTAVQYLTDQVLPLLSGAYSATVGTELFSAVAEFALSVAWMSYDSGLHGLARRHFVQALSLAHHAGDRLLGASVLSAMSHQANYLGDHRNALHLARAAEHGVRGHGQPLLQAQFAAMQARAAAALDARTCLDALTSAEQAFERHTPGDEPEWITYFDEAELADEIAHSFRDLGRPTESHRYATQCLQAGSDEYARSRTFSRIVLAESLVNMGELTEACRLAGDTLPRIADTASTRCTRYLRDFNARLVPHRNHPAVRDFTERSRPLLQSQSRQ